MLLLVPTGGVVGTSQAQDAGPTVLLAAATPNTYVSSEPDEDIVVFNQGPGDADLSAWRIQDSSTGACTSSEGVLRFPAGAVLPPGASWVITQNVPAWMLDRRGTPDWQWLLEGEEPFGGVGVLERACGRLRLADTQDEVLLLDATGAVVDALLYGGGARPAPGWAADPVPAPARGVVLERARPELGGALPDTDAPQDWVSPRVRRIGQSAWPLASFADVTGLSACVGPDAAFPALEAFVRGAQTRVDVSLYQWLNPHVLAAFEDALARGVQVRVLMEGNVPLTPTGRWHQQNWILARLVEAGAEVRYTFGDATQGIYKRYALSHQKVALRDGASAFVTSGNWTPAGLPTDPSFGNREWCVAVDSPGLVAYLTTVFEDDWDLTEYRDVVAFGAGQERHGPPPPSFEPDWSVPAGPYPHPFASAAVATQGTRVTALVGPDTSLLHEHPDALISQIRSAQERVLLAQLSVHAHWGPQGCGSACMASHPNPHLEAVLDAARRGAMVRVLLEPEFADPDDTRNNAVTVAHLNAVAAAEGLNLAAKLVDQATKALLQGVHTKGVVLDGRAAYVGSLNWTRASAQDNREVGLLVENPGLAAYFEDVFWHDWGATNLRADAVTLERDPSYVGVDPPVLVPARALVTFTNTGRREPGAHTVEVELRGAHGQVDRVTARVSGLAAGESMVVEVPWRKTLALGTFHLRAVVDTAGEVEEWDLGDNVVTGEGTLLADVPGVWADL